MWTIIYVGNVMAPPEQVLDWRERARRDILERPWLEYHPAYWMEQEYDERQQESDEERSNSPEPEPDWFKTVNPLETEPDWLETVDSPEPALDWRERARRENRRRSCV